MEISVSEAREQLAELINRVGYARERVAMVRHGRPMAALVPVADLRRLERLEGNAMNMVSVNGLYVKRGNAVNQPAYDVVALGFDDHGSLIAVMILDEFKKVSSMGTRLGDLIFSRSATFEDRS
jgi:prevent-host-death family protein